MGFLLSPIYIFILMYKAYKVYKTIAKLLVLLTLFFIHFQKQVYKIFKKRIKKENNMKTKLFFYYKWQQPLEEFEQEVNDFMATVQVIDVKYSTATVGDSDGMGAIASLLVLYK